MYITTEYGAYSAKMSPFLQDLTGKVRKTEEYYFANGGLADIWKGEWSRRGSKQIVL
jgi:uncharacterized protein with von Willebrand factor type A (vWA) domain